LLTGGTCWFTYTCCCLRSH